MVDIQLSRILNFLRFPLIVAVIFMHCDLRINNPELNNHTVFDILMYVSFLFITQAVPIFFFISGYLFFKEKTFSYELYIKKLKQRFHTLFIPYVLWIIIYFLVIGLLQYLFPNFLFILHKRIADFIPTDYFWIFWDISKITHLPGDQASCLVGAFWFLQCLFVLCILSPLLYFLMKYLRYMFPILVFAIYFFDMIPKMPGIHSLAIFYFSLGSFFSFYDIDFLSFIRKHIKIVIILLLLLIPIFYYIENIKLYRIFELIIISFIFYSAYYLVIKKEWKINKELVSSVFFIFALHRLISATLTRLSIPVVSFIPDDILLFFYYLLCVFITVVLSVCLYHLSRLFLPRLTSILNGGR